MDTIARGVKTQSKVIKFSLLSAGRKVQACTESMRVPIQWIIFVGFKFDFCFFDSKTEIVKKGKGEVSVSSGLVTGVIYEEPVIDI